MAGDIDMYLPLCQLKEIQVYLYLIALKFKNYQSNPQLQGLLVREFQDAFEASKGLQPSECEAYPLTCFFKDHKGKYGQIHLIASLAPGKTPILCMFKLGEIVTIIPTIGFNVEIVKYKNSSFTVWDAGGRDKIRSLWRHYFLNIQGVIFVVDSNDRDCVVEQRDAELPCELVIRSRYGNLIDGVIVMGKDQKILPLLEMVYLVGFASIIQKNKEDLELLKIATEKTGYSGKIVVGIDVVASKLHGSDQTYVLNFNKENNDGHLYILEADKRGVVAVVARKETDIENTLECKAMVLVEDTKVIPIALVVLFFRHPSRSMFVIGITKIHFYLIKRMYEAMGSGMDMLSNVAYDVHGDNKLQSTKDVHAILVQRMMANMVHNGTKALVMETSSHGLASGRCDEIDFDIAVFTDLTKDHMDFERAEVKFESVTIYDVASFRALKLFRRLNEDDIVSWTTMIGGFFSQRWMLWNLWQTTGVLS